MQIHQLLKLWRNLEGNDANVDSLLTVFREHRERANLLENSETYLSSLKGKKKDSKNRIYEK